MGEDDLDTRKYHEKPIARRSRPSLSNPRSTNDIVWAFHVRTQHCYGPPRIVSLQLAPSVGKACVLV